MTTISFNRPLVWGPTSVGKWNATTGTSGFAASVSLNDADNSMALICCAPQDGTIDAVGCYIQTLTGNPPAYYCGVVTVDSGTGNPNAAAYGGSAIETYDFTGTGWVWVTLATPATAQAGDYFAVRIWPTGTAPDGSNYVAIASDWLVESGTPHQRNYTTAWNIVSFISPIAARYSTGHTVGLPVVSMLYGNVDSGTNPDEVGNKFTVPMTMTCIGARILFRGRSANATYTAKLYDGADNVLASNGPNDEDKSSGNPRTDDVYWDPVTLSPGTTYRITYLPGDTADSTIAAVDYDTATDREYSLPDGANWQATQRTDAGAWTDDASGIVWLSLLISEITYTSSTGGAYGFTG